VTTRRRELAVGCGSLHLITSRVIRQADDDTHVLKERSWRAVAGSPGTRSLQSGLVATLDQCGSGRELDGRGHARDKFIAGELDVSSCVPRFDGIAFVAA
jgi:hypothetical protein